MNFNKNGIETPWSAVALLILALFLSLLASLARASSPGYEGARVYSFAQLPNNPEIIYAVGDGIYKSTNGGREWQALKLPFINIQLSRILLDPYSKQRAIAFSAIHTRSPGSYFESIDGGKNWIARSILSTSLIKNFFEKDKSVLNINSFSMHSSVPGLWLASVDEKIFRTVNFGLVWDELPQAATPILLKLSSINGSFYSVSKDQVWKSVDGSDWTSQNIPVGTVIENFFVFHTGEMFFRTQTGWFKSRNGRSWESTIFLSGYELRNLGQLTGDPQNLPSRRVRDFCSPQMSRADNKYLFAICSNNNMLLSGVVDFGIQLHSTDASQAWAPIKGEGLPAAWFPTAVALHPTDSRIILMAWITGRIYRSEDKGATWQSSDVGTIFPSNLKNFPEYGLPYLGETPLLQAVLRNDFVGISDLVAFGADINAKGNLDKTALEWAVILGANTPNYGEAMYWNLRTLGATPVGQYEEVGDRVIELAAQQGFSRIIEDFLHSGWRLTWKPAGENARSTLMRSTVGCGANPLNGCQPTFSGKPLEYWVNIHLLLVRPGESAQLVIDLIELGEFKLAERVARFDLGEYKKPAELVTLLRIIPLQSVELRFIILKSVELLQKNILYLTQLGDEDSAFLAGILVNDLKKTKLAALLFKDGGGDLGPHTVEFIIQLIKDNKVDLAVKVLRESKILSSERFQALLSGSLISLCDGDLLDRTLKAGVKLSVSTDEGESMVKAGFWACEAKKSPVNYFIERLHLSGYRLAREEWSLLNTKEVNYLLASKFSTYYRGFDRQTANIGLTWQASEGTYLEVASLIAGSPAETAGVQVGDRVVMIDSVDTRNIPVSYAQLLTRGLPRTMVKLTVFRNGSRIVFKLVRKVSAVISPSDKG